MKINSVDIARFVLEDAKTTLVLGNAFDLNTDDLLDSLEWSLKEIEAIQEEKDSIAAELEDKLEFERRSEL